MTTAVIVAAAVGYREHIAHAHTQAEAYMARILAGEDSFALGTGFLEKSWKIEFWHIL